MLRRLIPRSRTLSRILTILEQMHANQVDQTLQMLRQDARHKDPKNLIGSGFKIYSQTDEDGLIREIFQRIGVTDKSFVEFGVGDGLENNTLALILQGWKGLWIEAHGPSVRSIRNNLRTTIGLGALKVLNSRVTTGNIDDLIAGAMGQGEIDLLSIDIDGNDFHIFNAIHCVRPRVVVIEYNAKFPPPILFCMDYDVSHVWKGDDFFGASLKFLEIEFEKRGYWLVACNLAGTNAFFVRKELAGDHFPKPFSAENHYEPARYYLASFRAGHLPSHRTLERSRSPRAT